MKTAIVIAGLAALLLSAAPGCFVAEELDHSDQLMQRQSRSAAAVAAGPPGLNWIDQGRVAALQVAIWWEELGTKPAPPDDIVRCAFPDRTGFTMESDCRAQGGRVLS